MEAVAEGRAGAGVEAGSHIRPFPAHSKSPTWHLSKALWMFRLLPLLMIPLRLQNPNAVPGELGGGHCPQQEERLYPTHAFISSRLKALLPSQSLMQHPRNISGSSGSRRAL